MERLSAIDRDHMTAQQRAIYDDIVSGPRGDIRGPFLSWMHSPELADRAQKLGAFLRFKTRFSRRHSELAILITAAVWQAQFEWWAHARIAREAGLEDAIIDALQAGARPRFTSAEDGAIYDFVSELHHSHRVGDDAFKRVRDLFGEPATVELVALVGYYVMVAMTLNVFKVPLPEGETLPFPDAETG